MQQLQAEPKVRVLSRGGVLLRFVALSEAHYLHRSKQGKWSGRVTRTRPGDAIVMANASVNLRIPGGQSYIYRETLSPDRKLAQNSVVALKRISPEGELLTWDPGLTFAELRNGHYVSASTAARMANRASSN